MSDFVTDGSILPTNKVDASPPTGPVTQRVSASEWNAVNNAAMDLRAHVLDLEGVPASLKTASSAAADSSGSVLKTSVVTDANGSSLGYVPIYDTAHNAGIAGTVTTAALTLYVDPAGSDANPGTIGSPMQTVQAALNRVPKHIYHPVTIQLTAGNFAGAYVDGFNIHAPADPTTNYSWLHITGTIVDFVPSTGTTSGTLTGFAASSDSGFAAMTHAGQTWTVDQLKGQFVEITSGTGSAGTISAPSFWEIVSNTATTLTVLGTATAPTAGSGYRLRTTASFFTSAPTLASSSNSPAAITLPSAGGLSFFNNTGVGIVASRLGFTLGTSCPRGIVTSDSTRIRFFLLRMIAGAGTSTGFIGTSGIAGGGVTLQISYMNFVTAGVPMLYAGTGGGAVFGGQTVTSTMFEGGSTAMNLSGTPGMTLSNCYFKDQTAAAIQSGGVMLAQINSCRFLNCVTAYTVQENSSTGLNHGSVAMSHCDISNCTNGILLAGPFAAVWLMSVSGTGNTTAINISHGSKVRISSSSSITGTTELNIDGATGSNFATMRAASPKLLNTAYGTIIYE